jgi:hypothetical protein
VHFITFRVVAVSVRQSSASRVHVPIVIESTCIINLSEGNVLLPHPMAFHFTIDPRQQAWKAQICMRNVITAVVMVLVDRKSEALDRWKQALWRLEGKVGH